MALLSLFWRFRLRDVFIDARSASSRSFGRGSQAAGAQWCA